ncbi:protein downstream neighbor of son homolog isoform X2 [Triticum dicoccoides]|uniref:protein downstream neighbor of son homolog isoform X2 n=1 Tax=Triticum dicoccoides TaxID=85692 RepID=UPI00188FF295|nr:protein downstream neighbor of son homolog isoform X2 [Triticum dicoccoides]
MAQAAVEPAASGGAFIGRPAEAPRMKRKTPSELREEQLKRRVSEKVADDPTLPSAAFDRPSNGPRNPEQQKISKYISTRVTEVFPVKKSRNVGKENCKDALLNNEKAPKYADAVTASQSAESPFPRDGDSAQLDSSVPSLAEAAKPGFRKAEKCSKNALRSVSELHIGDEKQAGSSKFDMDKVMKGFGARGASGVSSGTNIQAGDVPLKCSEVCPSMITIPGKRAPLDLTLKTTLQFVSSSSVKWCHNLSTSCRGSIAGGRSQSLGRTRHESNKEFLFLKALQSWVYPQSMLPAPILSAMLSTTARGEKEFIHKRYQDWEDSFQNLYYMFRKNLLNIFYVYTAQFFALFIRGNCLEKQSCNAYLSQSTRGMRSLLRKQGVCFSMPLCKAEMEQATEDDLIEFSKIRTLNLGQTLHIDALSEVDNTTQSLLSFTGNKSVHGLYDVLLNYKFFLNSLSAADVPVLYSPVPFQNGSLHSPEVICREMRKADSGLAPSSVFDDAGEPGSEVSDPPLAAGSMCYSMEIKDAALPPWVVSGVSAVMTSDTDRFDLTIATEPSSVGLNAALASLGADGLSKTTAVSEGVCEALGVPGAVLVLSLRSAVLRGLSYECGEYLARTTA